MISQGWSPNRANKMSYILDALRKSEEERLRERSPDFLREPVVTPSPVMRRWPRLVIALAIALLGAGGWLAWDRPWRPPGEQKLPPAAAVDPQSMAGAATQPARPGETLTPVIAPPDSATLQPRQGTSAAPPSVDLPRARKAPEPPNKSASVQERAPRKTPSSEIPPPPNRVLHLSELPPALRDTLPNLAVHGFVYSEDSGSRMVVINNRMLQEGDDIGADLKLERIGPDGAVLNYKGYRFLAPR